LKTARFSQVVETAGRPIVYLTWMKPQRDPALRTALKANRVMTVHQTVRGSGTDYGTVGLHLGGHSQILIFPRSLKRFEDRRIVGIKYELFAEASVRSAEKTKSLPPANREHGRERSAKKVLVEREAHLPSSQEGDDVSSEEEAEETEETHEERPHEQALSWHTLEARIRTVLGALKRRRVAEARADLSQLVQEIHAQNADEKSTS
jgi:hypothetical protein